MAWGRTPDAYILPSIELVVAGAGWLSGAAIGSWSIDRELVASTIPGNIRERTGLSIGAAQVTVRPSARATPWSKVPANVVTTGVPATLRAVDPVDGVKQLGAWVTDDESGRLSAEAVQIALLEASRVGIDMPQTLPPYDNTPFTRWMPVDPVWPIPRMLEKVGFPAVPVGRAGTLLRVPMDGAIQSSSDIRPWSTDGEIAGGWSLMPDGTLGGSSGSGIRAIAQSLSTPVGTTTWHLALNVVGTVYLFDFAQGWLVRVVNNQATGTYNMAASNNLGASWGPTQTFVGRQSADWPDRVQIELTRTLAQSGSMPSITWQWTTTSARVRSSLTAAWSALSTHSVAKAPAGNDPTWNQVQVVGGLAIDGIPGIPASPAAGRFSAFIMDYAQPTSDALWTPRKAYLKPFGGDLGMPMVPDDVDAWGTIQDCASANLGAVIIDLDGIARVLTKDDLAAVPTATVDVGTEFEDLDWTLDSDDTADRVQVAFTVPSITMTILGSTTLAPEAWRSDGVITLPAGETVTISAVFDNVAAVGVFKDYLTPIGAPTSAWSQMSNLILFDNPDGTGSPLSTYTGISIDTQQTSSTTVAVKITNGTGTTLYAVDGNGDSGLILRARTVATFGTPQIVERGAAVETAKNPLEVDLTPWVQTKQQAQSIADYLWDRVSGNGLWKVLSAKCRLDWSLDIGQVRSIAHAPSGLDSKVLITKVNLDGEPGQITQTVDMVLIPWTYTDFAAKWPGKTYAQFATAQGTRTYADHAADPLWTGA